MYLVTGEYEVPIYYADKPQYRFVSRQSGGVTVADKHPTWSMINVEVPLGVGNKIASWHNKGDRKNIALVFSDMSHNPVEQWQIRNASIYDKLVRRGRYLNFDVLVLMINYEWASRVK